jgi:hypothetical protein
VAGPTPDHKAIAPELVRTANEPPPLPRWVYVFGIAAIIALVLFFIVHFAGLMPMHG